MDANGREWRNRFGMQPKACPARHDVNPNRSGFPALKCIIDTEGAQELPDGDMHIQVT
jgi:hypothetical protein